MDFKEFNNLIINKVLMQPLPGDELGGDENEYHNLHKDRIYKTLCVIPETAGKNALDLGCEPGYIAIALKVMGYTVRGGGVNLIKDFKARMDRFQIPIDVYNLDIDDLPYKDEQFDVVIFSEIIEHLFYGVPHALTEINRIIKKDGFLILTTPNLSRVPNRIRLLLGKSVNPELGGKEPFFSRDIYKRHNREYIFEELVYLLEKAGFKIDRYFYWNYPAYTYKKPIIKRIANCVSEIIPKSKDIICVVAVK